MNELTQVLPAEVTTLIEQFKTSCNRGPNRLSRREDELLDYLGTHAGRVVTRDELLANVWKLDPSCTGTRTIDMHMANLRRKLRSVPGLSNLLRTVRGQGYMLVQPDPAEVRFSPASPAHHPAASNRIASANPQIEQP